MKNELIQDGDGIKFVAGYALSQDDYIIEIKFKLIRNDISIKQQKGKNNKRFRCSWH